ncbi:MAG: MATE family efflux transporter [Lachnospiraceae bacterium]|nr:MATE family efflux transporter [Lachnospiraceae bacterium]
MSTQKENKMGVMPVNRLILTMSLPIMISMLVQAMYNIVDSMFVSKLGESAFTALSLAFPMQNLMIAVGSGTGVGVNALVSRYLGEKKFDEANKGANCGIFLAILSAIVFSILCLFGSKWVFVWQKADEIITQYGTEYLTICGGLCYGLFAQFIFERLLQCTGKTIFSMITQITGAVINIVLDPILIFGYFGCPAMGVRGAAIATVIGQVCAAAFALILNIMVNKELTLSIRSVFQPKAGIIGKIYWVGVPSIIMASVSSVMNFGMNIILMKFTSTAAAVFGAYFKIQSFIFMPVFGLNNGIIPIISYNYGARNKKRLHQAMKYGIIYAVLIMVLGFIIMQIFPGKLLSIFEATPLMLEMGIPAIRIISTSFLFAGFCIACSSIFQAFGKGFLSMMISIVRQLLVLLPVAFLMSLSGNITMVWLAWPIAELFSLLLSILFLVNVNRKIIRPMTDE